MTDRLVFRKSSHSGGGQDCVEVADLPGAVAVRDSKDPSGTVLTLSRLGWRRLADVVKSGALSR